MNSLLYTLIDIIENNIFSNYEQGVVDKLDNKLLSNKYINSFSKPLKQAIQSGENNIKHNNIKYIKGIIYQPFGTQQFPDFLIIESNKDIIHFICVELKSSKTNKSLWNCGCPLPYSNTVYIHINKKLNKKIYILGNELINKNEYDKIFKLWNELQLYCKNIKQTKKMFKLDIRRVIIQNINYNFDDKQQYLDNIKTFYKF